MNFNFADFRVSVEPISHRIKTQTEKQLAIISGGTAITHEHSREKKFMKNAEWKKIVIFSQFLASTAINSRVK